MSFIVQYIFAGIRVGSMYAVVAIGFNIIYSATGIINFAQGEFVMLGAMIAHSLDRVLPLGLAIAAAVLMTSLIGSLVDIVFMRRLKNPTVLKMVIVTIGVSILLREIALHVWDEKVRALPFFSGNEVSSIRILGAFISPQDLWVAGIMTVMVGVLFVFMSATSTGRAMRACAANLTAAKLCAVSTGFMINLSFIISAGMGALAGCIVSPLSQTHYNIGPELAIKGFTVAILGGLGNSAGAVIAGLLLGLIESFSIRVIPMAYKDVIAISILLVILVLKPSGLFVSRKMAALKEY